jgi:magnesium chelatase family protein
MPVRPGTKGRCRPSPLRKPHPRSNEHWPTRAHSHGPTVNGRMTPRQVRTLCKLKLGAQSILKAPMEELGLSARAHDKVLRVACTIADLEGSDEIKP